MTGLLRAMMDCDGHSSEGGPEEGEMKTERPSSAGSCCLGLQAGTGGEDRQWGRQDLGQD